MADMDEPTTGTQEIGNFALKFIDTIEQVYGSEIVIESVGMVAEVSFPMGSGFGTALVCWSNEDRLWVQSKLFEKAARESDERDNAG